MAPMCCKKWMAKQYIKKRKFYFYAFGIAFISVILMVVAFILDELSGLTDSSFCGCLAFETLTLCRIFGHMFKSTDSWNIVDNIWWIGNYFVFRWPGYVDKKEIIVICSIPMRCSMLYSCNYHVVSRQSIVLW